MTRGHDVRDALNAVTEIRKASGGERESGDRLVGHARCELRSVEESALPKLDRGLSALLEDMDARGLLMETLVVAIGEFGRSPRIGVSTSGNSNAPDGRNHWQPGYGGAQSPESAARTRQG